MKRAIKVTVRILAVLVTIVALWLLYPAYTPRIRDGQGREISNSIASLEQITLGGVPQCILIRGRDRNNPVLLMLHGGPGMPQMYLAHKFQRELEKNFVVVQWDRRGAGKSFTKGVSPQSLNIDQLVADTHQLVEYLRERFHQPKVFVAGHSWGTYLGLLTVQRYPELFYGYVGMGQMTDAQKSREVRREFLLRRARETHNQKAVDELTTKGPSVEEKWLFEFGGELHNATSFWPLLSIGLRAPEYTAADALYRLPSGLRLYGSSMNYEGHDDLVREVTAVNVPVYFFLGRHDYNTPSDLAADYLAELNAPSKKLVWFENSAHFPFIEEPEKFAAEMAQVRSDIAP